MFLLKVAVDTLGATNVLACLGISASLGEYMHRQAIEMGNEIGKEISEFQVGELADSNYCANKADRCYHCKKHLFTDIVKIAKAKNFEHILCGNNFDDKDDYRPGNKAAIELKILAPLMDAKMTKREIREISQSLNLKTADAPASPCLSSRMSYGLEITQTRLKQIEDSESVMRELGFKEFRVRHHNELARIEVREDDLQKILSSQIKDSLIAQIKKIGFTYVTIDLQGFRSGSMNEKLSKDEMAKNL